MAVTKLSICNSALVKVGADRISSITQDTKSAILLNAVYEQVRDAVQAAHPWNFNQKRSVLYPTGVAPAFEYASAYDLPSDCLAVIDAFSFERNDIDFVVENSQILCDETAELNVLYSYRHDNETAWSAYFAEAFAWRLAQEVSYNLTQSLSLMDLCEKKYNKELSEARSRDGAEGVIRSLIADKWTNSRR